MNFEEKLNSVFIENDITIIDYTDEKGVISYKCNKCNTVYKNACARNLLSKITLCKKCYNPFSRWNKERIQKFKLNRLYPDSKIEIVSFKSFREGGEVKCLKCGEIELIKNFEALFSARKDCFCNNCEKNKNIIFNHLQEELNRNYLKLLEWNGVNEKAKFQCNRCGYIFNKNVSINFDGQICPNCFKVHNKFNFQEAEKLLKEKAGEEYTLLQFTGTSKKSLIKHKCGFCYSARIEDFEKTKGCPKCFKKYSSLEQKVANFLDKNNYKYIRQKAFDDLKRFSFDFEVEIGNNKILIEVQGQQHYKQVEIFDEFEKQQKRDAIKKEYCLVNNIPLIEIPYYEINNLDKFLLLKFNDYLEREQT